MPQTPRILQPLRCIWPAAATLGEGTLWSPREQALYWVDILQHRLHRFGPVTEARTTWDFDEEITAVAERASAPGLIVTLRRGFALFDPAEPATPARYLYQPPQEATGNRFNDGKCDAHGRFWGGTMDAEARQPLGALYRYDPDGQCTRHEEGFPVTNGPTWSLDGRTLFLNDTARGRVFAYDFDMDAGCLSNRREWHRFAREEGHPDGMTTDAAGRLWIAHWGGACVTCHAPEDAREIFRIDLPTRHVTNCAFGGPDLRTLFITSATSGLTPAQREAEPLAGGLFAVGLDVAGLESPRFGG